MTRGPSSIVALWAGLLSCTAETEGLQDLQVPVPVPPQSDADPSDGWMAAPGEGTAFIVSDLVIAGRDEGFDLDGNCATDGTGCVDNGLWILGPLANDQIRQGLLGGESLLLVELVGYKGAAAGDDSALTVKFYPAKDADDPFFPANNFKVPAGQASCCEFLVSPSGLFGAPPQALARLPARAEGMTIRSTESVSLPIVSTVDPDPIAATLERATVEISIDPATNQLRGRLGVAVPASALAKFSNPYCKTVGPRCPVAVVSSLLDLLVMLKGPRPDVDLDGDGLECILDTDGDAVIDRCCEGTTDGGCREGSCLGEVIEPGASAGCVDNPRVADGYSITIGFAAVPATIVGVAP
jgi:hypothetical protein